ncbi:serine hydrolase domain-containing protein [Sphingomonas floccifaciens]|uniref:Serine hydrolase domain-containing protein n=1 Tax=Sphingomonas floccifaciens TaxID=1844115 RepID=A0ABW4NED2_9SPHN
MIDRRSFLVSSAAVAVGSAASARGIGGGKADAIAGIALPAGFNGIIAYARNGRIEHVRSAGFADVEERQPFSAATAIRWGSASKWLTSVAALRLVEMGRLRLDASIATYLPQFRADTGNRVLVHHLLSNTSGIPDLLSRQLASEPDLRTSTAATADIVARFGGGDLAFQPGDGWDYAALNWAIVAQILERVSGEAFPAVMRRLVLRPLAMSGAGFVQSDQRMVPNLAAAYGAVAPPVRKMATVPAFLAASGNVAGTVGDAVRAAHGIFHGPLLKPASRTELAKVRWPAQEYVLGGRIHPVVGEPWAWETGKVQAYRTHIAHRLARSETIVVFNTTDMEQSQIGSWVETIARA